MHRIVGQGTAGEPPTNIILTRYQYYNKKDINGDKDVIKLLKPKFIWKIFKNLVHTSKRKSNFSVTKIKAV